MTNVVIDPYILAYPSRFSSKEDIDNYINNMMDWEEIIETTSLDILVSSKMSEILVLENNYPVWDNLKDTFRQYDVNYLQPKDIINVIEKFTKLKKLEEQGIFEILFDNVNFDDRYINSRSQNYKKEFERIIMFISLYNTLDIEYLLLTKGDFNNQLQVSGELLEVECSHHYRKNFTLGFLKSNIQIVLSFRELYSSIDPVFVWKKGCLDSYREALIIAVYQRTGNFEQSNWCFGKEFFKTVKSLGFKHEYGKIKSLIKTMVDTILRDNLTAIHSIREDLGGNSPQVERGNDKAYRRDIDHNFHLHYWDSGQKIEFAVVVVHNDIRIPV